MKAETISRWVKVSESRPDNDKAVDLKCENIFYHGKLSYFKETFLEQAEWLEEQPNMIVLSEKQLNDFANHIHEDCYNGGNDVPKAINDFFNSKINP